MTMFDTIGVALGIMKVEDYEVRMDLLSAFDQDTVVTIAMAAEGCLLDAGNYIWMLDGGEVEGVHVDEAKAKKLCQESIKEAALLSMFVAEWMMVDGSVNEELEMWCENLSDRFDATLAAFEEVA